MSTYSISDISLNSNLDSESEPDFNSTISSSSSTENLEMTIIEEARNIIPSTDGLKNLKKFIDITDKFSTRINAAFTNQFIMLILSKLDGMAYDVASNCEPSDWPTIKEALKDAFLGFKSLNTLHRELSLLTQKPDEKVQPYSLRVKSVIKELSQAYKKLDELNTFYENDEHLSSAFEDGLFDKNIKILVKATAVSFTDAVSIAMREEAKLSSMIYREKQTCSFCNSETHVVSSCFELKKNNNICYICKNVGHFPSNCRRKIFIENPQNYSNRNNFNNQSNANRDFSYQNSTNRNGNFDRFNYNESNSYDPRRRETSNQNSWNNRNLNYNNNTNFNRNSDNQNYRTTNNQNNNYRQNQNQNSGNFRNANYNSGNFTHPGRNPAIARMRQLN
jgi:hypothetical protein